MPAALLPNSRAPPIWRTKLCSVAVASALILAAEAASLLGGAATIACTAIRISHSARMAFMSLNPSRLSARVSSNKQLYAHRDNANQKSEGTFSLIDETEMPKPRQRACLEQGLKLDLNKLTRQGLMRRGAKVGPRIINRWTYSYTGEEIARGCRHCEHGRQIRGLAEDLNRKPGTADNRTWSHPASNGERDLTLPTLRMRSVRAHPLGGHVVGCLFTSVALMSRDTTSRVHR